MEKRCFKCQQVKDISEFYVHRQMGDGHLGKCKTCTCDDARRQRELNLQDPEWIKQEAERCREKSARYRAAGIVYRTSYEVQQKWRQRNREKSRAHTTAHRAQKNGFLVKPLCCERCEKKTENLHKHHPDYLKPKEVQWLCTTCHGIIHRKH